MSNARRKPGNGHHERKDHSNGRAGLRVGYGSEAKGRSETLVSGESVSQGRTWLEIITSAMTFNGPVAISECRGRMDQSKAMDELGL